MNDTSEDIRIAVILGTTRPGNYTSKAVALVVDELQANGIAVDTFDPAEMPLLSPGAVGDNLGPERLREMVKGASGVILSTPEYHGGISSTIKLVIENLGFPSVLAGKPVALLGVAAGRIGAIKSLEQLRSICSHVGSIVLPGPVSVAGVRQVFDEDGRCLDGEAEKQIRSVATKMVDYVRQSVCPAQCLEVLVRAS
ncbi:MAG: NAD(P)H-dependent oxidoreductase [Gemmatimonadetes bacterium]|nr:NAD(P)H-dependent oxidoreductase [Gemmatimonadota bacterium]